MDINFETMSDEDILSIVVMQMSEAQQQELSDLLSAQREEKITSVGSARLDELMQSYRLGLVRKAQATKFAAERGLIPRLG